MYRSNRQLLKSHHIDGIFRSTVLRLSDFSAFKDVFTTFGRVGVSVVAKCASLQKPDLRKLILTPRFEPYGPAHDKPKVDQGGIFCVLP